MTTLHYRMPVSRIRIAGTVTTTADEVTGVSRVTGREATASLGVMAARGEPLGVDLDPGWFADSDACFTLTEDGRLSGASMTTTGQGAAIVSGVVGIVATVVGGLIGKVPVRAQFGNANMVAVDVGGQPGAVHKLESGPASPEDAYAARYPVEAMELRAAHDRLRELRSQLRAALDALATGGPVHGAATTAWIRQLVAGIAQAEADVDRGAALYGAWRATTLHETSTEYTFDLTMDDLLAADPRIVGDQVEFPGPISVGQDAAVIHAARVKVQEAWDTLGSLVIVSEQEEDPGLDQGSGDADGARLLVRHPRRVTLQVYEKTDTGIALIVRQFPALVLDGRCRHEPIRVEEGMFSKHAAGLTFSPDGILTGFNVGSTSAVAGGVTALAGVPGGVSAALETASKTGASLEDLRAAGDEYALRRMKLRVEAKQQELALEGLERTSKDVAELEWLNQQVALLEAHHKLAAG